MLIHKKKRVPASIFLTLLLRDPTSSDRKVVQASVARYPKTRSHGSVSAIFITLIGDLIWEIQQCQGSHGVLPDQHATYGAHLGRQQAPGTYYNPHLQVGVERETRRVLS